MKSISELIYLVDHLFLPPKLPQNDDYDNNKDNLLLGEFEKALLSYEIHICEEQRPRWKAFRSTARTMLSLRDLAGHMSTSTIECAFENIGEEEIRVFHIRGQNAGLIVRNLGGHYRFELFEVSPTNEAVMESKGRLKRSFPDSAVCIGAHLMKDASFRRTFADLIARLDMYTPGESRPQVTKAKTISTETRDTIHPKFATEMFSSILQGVGEGQNVPRTWKHTREDVLWDNTLQPWRRSALYLVLRVALQTSLNLLDESSPSLYKRFMIFFLARILQDSLAAGLPDDLLFVMSAKIGRRVLKLGDVTDMSELTVVEEIVEAVQQKLRSRWDALQQNPDPFGYWHKWKTLQTSFQSDTNLKVVSLQRYLDAIPTRATGLSRRATFTPQCQRRVVQHYSALPDLAPEQDIYTLRLTLTDVESWVRDHLDQWLETNLHSLEACKALVRLINQCISIALPAYSGQPMETSLMLLTLLRLWVALDICTVKQQPLLLKYSPGFRSDQFDALILPESAHLTLLAQIEEYIQKRSRNTLPASFIFEDFSREESFAVRFFDQSQRHQYLRESIEERAAGVRVQKKQELARKQERHRDLLREAKSLSCEDVTRWNGEEYYTTHDPGCHKCALKRTAAHIKIDVHEWPLPSQELEARSAVFELDVPIAISQWRNTTYTLLVDIFSPKLDTRSGSHLYYLRDSNGLSAYWTGETGRVQLGSETKPFSVSHYRDQHISIATEDSLCVNNGLRFALRDTKSGLLTRKLLGRCEIGDKCTFKIPAGPFAALQYALASTLHTSNEILSRQALCPDSLNLHEYYAFATLRAGFRLQWLNVARNIADQVLDFGREEVHLLVLQSIWQAGPRTQAAEHRDTHICPTEEVFGLELLSKLGVAIQAVEGNWQSACALRTYTMIAARLCSLSPHPSVHRRCYCLLRDARRVALRWMHDVKDLYTESQDSGELKELSLRSLEMALTCHNTFTIDEQHSLAMLESSGDLATVIECSISIHDHCPPETATLPFNLEMLLRRFQRSSLFFESRQRRMILGNAEGINAAVSQIWEGYRPGTPWTAYSIPNERWVMTGTASDVDDAAAQVHYNVITGELLVDGCSLSRLPPSYQLSSTYQRLFGQKILDVVPSRMEGMIYTARHAVHGQQVHFNMYGSTLVIRAKSEQIWEVVPVSTFKEDFPAAFANDYIHWLNLATGQIEWRPLDTAWLSSNNNWLLMKNDHGERVLRKGSDVAVDIGSATAKSIATLMAPLEIPTNIHISFDEKRKEIKICLPRFKLEFSAKEPRGEIESKQFRSMIVDDNQAIGTFTGLVNQLVLRNANDARTVLVPHGTVKFESSHNHVQVTIQPGKEKRAKYHAYYVDAQLHRLVDNGHLLSRLFRLYLHATTSSFLVDNLTGRTGTEEALFGLRGAATASFTSLGSSEAMLLEKLAHLSPKHHFYPPHLRVMQQIKWNALPALSQHGEFYKKSMEILHHAARLEIFCEHPNNNLARRIEQNTFLLERAMARNASFHVSGFGAENFSAGNDQIYSSRGNIAEKADMARSQNVYRIARLVNKWSPNVKGCRDLQNQIESWNHLIRGPSIIAGAELGFDLKWLKPFSEFMPDYWCRLCETLRQSDPAKDRFVVLVFLSILAYSPHAQQDLVDTLLSFATNPTIRALPLPNESTFKLEDGYRPTLTRLTSLTNQSILDFQSCPESNLPKLSFESKSQARIRRKQEYEQAKTTHVAAFAREVQQQWPNTQIRAPGGKNYAVYISVEKALDHAGDAFQSCQRNCALRAHNRNVETVLESQEIEKLPLMPHFTWLAPQHVARKSVLSFADLTLAPAPYLPEMRGSALDYSMTTAEDTTANCGSLELLLERIDEGCSNEHDRRYASDLRASLRALRQTPRRQQAALSPGTRLDEHLRQHHTHLTAVFQCICDRMQADASSIVRKAGLLPRLTPSALLSLLRRGSPLCLTQEWKACLVEYGCALTNLQRARRLLNCSSNALALSGELQNAGHENWNPLDHPEWLLLEIENNIAIRPEQAQIAKAMIAPASEQNCVMQLNMGLGKSSVITPMVAAELADGSKLTRVVVLKPLAMQMFHLLATRLGGLLNRRIWYMPISRSLQPDTTQARQIQKMYQECMKSGGVLLVQPEHLLSFELLGFERSLSAAPELGQIMMETEDWLRHHSRDILDESDEILSVRFELIYTIGTQRNIDFSPHRWDIIQAVLRLIGRLAPPLAKRYPEGLEVIADGPGSFLRVRILGSQAGEELLRDVAREVCEKGIVGLPVWNLPQQERIALFEYLTNAEAAMTMSDRLSSLEKGLLLLRGMFSEGILRFALGQKRWRVNFGLDPARTMLAVPYNAKDSPTARSEFSHPDATIVFTCLSYYYGGLSDDLLQRCFEELVQSDHASEEYAQWVADAPELAQPYRYLSGINLKHTARCARDIFPFLKFAPAAINYYLRTFVFPAQMKEFPHKLSSSGWDIARQKQHPTTGFSGTNDSRYILPLSIEQTDMGPQRATNALVLQCLLRPENLFIPVEDSTINAETLIGIATSPPQFRVILDVGAQVLELQNEQVVEKWLGRCSPTDVQAAIFFDKQDEICVLSRDGLKEPLLTSPFLKQMDKCIVYLDEAHTRGTDLQLPEDYRALLTLGPSLTKDRLAQANIEISAMRMRKLGQGQSVALCGSREVQQKIRECVGRSEAILNVADVLQWCCAVTCAQTKRNIPLWRTQGIRHQHRCSASLHLCSTSEPSRAEFVRSILEPEAQTLKQRYGDHISDEVSFVEKFPGRETQLKCISDRCREFGVSSFDTATLQEEQERELSPEIEREQQAERPPVCKPHLHKLHQDLRRLVKEGVLDRSSDAFQPAVHLFTQTSAAVYLESPAWSAHLLTTKDYSRTIQASKKDSLDDFLRPVHWILSYRNEEQFGVLVISPYEAHELLPLIRQSKHVNLHVYSPRVNTLMQSLDDLSYCSEPQSQATLPIAQIRMLNLFAGQLYFQNFEEYTAVSEFLGLCSEAPGAGIRVASDGFVDPECRTHSKSACRFLSSPIEFLRAVVAMRRKGQSFADSHLGKVLNGHLLARDAFEAV